MPRENWARSASERRDRWEGVRVRRRARPAPRPAADDGPLRLLREQEQRDAVARERADRFRDDMDEASRVLRRWAADFARSRQAQWSGFEATTQLVAVELGREAAAAARNLLRAGRTLEQGIAHGIAMAEELIPGIDERLGLQLGEWMDAPAGTPAQMADRRRRIGRLRAKAAATAYVDEAASFTAKADQLAAKYGIDA